jgi:hydroxymethylbilane synthase
VTIKLKCRLGSDSDHLSKLQLQEVIDSLSRQCSKVVFHAELAPESDLPQPGKGGPNSPARVATLMKNLLEDRFDALVVNATCVPPVLPAGIAIGAVTGRLTPYDVIISKDDEIFDELPADSSVIANDVRREAQLLYYRHDLRMVKSRGSIDSLIQKVKSAKVDAVILSAADVERLQKQDYVAEVFTNSICVPAAGQGSLAVLVRTDDDQCGKIVHAINDPASLAELTAEWAFMKALSLSEADPVGVLGSIEGKKIELEGVLALPDGTEKIRSSVSGMLGKEEDLGHLLANEILEAGGREILQELNLL